VGKCPVSNLLCDEILAIVFITRAVEFLRICYGVFTRSSKRPANFQQMYSNTLAEAGRLLEVC